LSARQEKISGIYGNITGIQKGISLKKALLFIIDLEHHVHQTGVAAASCRTVFFMNSFIITAIIPKGIEETLLNMNGFLAGERIISRKLGTGKKS
jgi:hypothetical protein